MNPGVQTPPDHQEATTPAAWPRRLVLLAGGLLLIYFVVAYLLMPLFWRTDTRRHPDLSDGPRITHTANGIPGDPVNLALVGSESDLIHAMTAAAWDPADPITFRSSVLIAVDSVFRRPDDDAPVSDLFLFGRKQDLAFEQPVGDSPRQRHHVRFWRWDELHDGRPVWFGSATFDERVGLSHETGQITHHIGPDVDAERDRILSELQKARQVQEPITWTIFISSSKGRTAAAIRGTPMAAWVSHSCCHIRTCLRPRQTAGQGREKPAEKAKVRVRVPAGACPQHRHAVPLHTSGYDAVSDEQTAGPLA